MPPREIRRLRVDLSRVSKLAGKGITIEEVRQAIANASSIHRGPRNTRPDQEGQCYFVIGRADSGRTLKVLVRRFTGGDAHLITAWEPRKRV